MRFGFHVSIAGGVAKSVERAHALGCETMQIFTRNPRAWRYGDLDPDEVRRFREACRRRGVDPVVVHLPYLPNLAARRGRLRRLSIEALRSDLARADALGARAVVCHPGHRGSGRAGAALRRVAAALDEAMDGVGGGVMVLLENTAGQGTEVASSFSELAKVMEQVRERERVGICLDTAHAFARGYDLSSEQGLASTLAEVEDLIGLASLDLLHLNDTRAGLGSRIDRHWHIGSGRIGRAGFRRIIHHPFCSCLPGIMETPLGRRGDDRRNMRTLRRLAEEGESER
jgi:deoxyribonuclease-4